MRFRSFSRSALLLAALALLPAATQAQDTLKVLSSGRLLRYNGHDRVPTGLFGVHSTGLNQSKVERWGIEQVRTIQAGPTGTATVPGTGVAPANIGMVIDCWYDRYRPALLLENPGGWRTALTNLATNYATNTLGTGRTHYLEFWNEPFLNWESKPGVNYDPRFYDTTTAVVGGPVYLKNSSTPLEHCVWKRHWWVNQISPAVNDYVSVYVNVASRWSQFEALPIGGTITVGSRVYKKFESWLADDTSTTSYYSGRQNALYYNRMYSVAATALKAVNPNLRVLAGWGQQFHQDNYNSFRLQIVPTIDSNINLIDGLHEHHYGGDARNIGTGYEVAWNYAKGRYGKSLGLFNTESGGYLDPQIPGNASSGKPSDPLVASRGGYSYTYRDINYLLAHSPDKAMSRCAHEADLNGGDTVAFKQMKFMRGRLVSTTTNSSTLVGASAWQNDRLTMTLFNESTTPRLVQVRVLAPKGYILGAGIVLSAVDSSDNAHLAERVRDVAGFDTAFTETITMGPRQPLTYVFGLTGMIDTVNYPVIEGIQHAHPQVLTEMQAGQSRTYEFILPAGEIAAARAARLKIGLGTNNGGTVTIGNFTAALPAGSYIQYLDVPVAELSPATNVVINSNGALQIRFVSLDLLTQPLPMPVAARPAVEAQPLVVSPNPFSNWMRVQAQPGTSLNKVELFGMDGKQWINQPASGNSWHLHESSLPRGVYMLRVSQANGVVVQQRLVRE